MVAVDQTETGLAAQSPPAAAMMRLVVGGYASQALCVTARLGVADVLAEGPQPVELIARQVGAHDHALYRILRAVAELAVVTELDGRRFALTALGDLLRSDVPGSLRAWATMIGMPFWHRTWSELYEVARTGEPSFIRANGADFFEHLAANPEDARAFEAGMSSLYTYRTVIGAYNLSKFSTIVDIGGGSGAVLAETLAANPHLRGVLFDSPEAVACAAEVLSKAGVSSRCRVVGGDILSPVPGEGGVPEEGDLYLLSGMIHVSTDDQAVRILSACRAAMSANARLLIAETVLPDGSRQAIGKFMDLQMLAFTADGYFRTEAEIRSLLGQAGFRWVRIAPSSAVVSLVEAVPRSLS
jgi:precorrin-6B methylase 2